MVGLAALVTGPEKWGQHPFVLGVQSARDLDAALHTAPGRDGCGVGGERKRVPKAGSGSESSQNLFLQDCTFFTRKEIMRSVWGEREEDTATTFCTSLEGVCNLTHCFVAVQELMGALAGMVSGWRQTWGG